MDTSYLILPDAKELKKIFDFSPVATCISDVNSEAYFFNTAWQQFTGKAEQAEFGTGWQRGLHPDDIQVFSEHLKSSGGGRREFKLKCRYRRHDGEYRTLAMHSTPCQSREGEFSGYMLTSADIHDLLSGDTEEYKLRIEAAYEREQALNEELAATNEEMSAANEELLATNEDLLRSQNDLARLNADLGDIVSDRTKSLKESQHRMRKIIETAPFPIGVYVGREMRIEFANKAITDVWGKGEDVAGKLYAEVLPELENQEIFTQLDHVFTSGIPFHAESQRVDLVVMGEPVTYYFNYSFTALYDTEGEIYGVVNTAADVTEQVLSRKLLEDSYQEQQAISEELAASNEELASTVEELTAINEELTEVQENLLRSEKLFKSIALNIPGSLVIVIDKEQRFVAIEGDLMEKFGYNSPGLTGKLARDVSPPESYESLRELYERVLSGEDFSVERKNEAGEDFIVHLVPLRDELNEVYAGLLITLDVTPIKSAEFQSARLAAIVHSSNDAIVSKGLDGIISSWNQSAERMFGYTEDEMVGESILKLIPDDRQDEEPLIIAQIRKGKRVEHFETKRRRKDGSMIDVSLSISPVTDRDGKIIGVSKIARDITEKKLEETRKNDFIGMVSHELKTPLTSLSALIQVLRVKLSSAGDPFVAGVSEKATVQVNKMAKMINGFLNVSRLESGQLMIERREFELRALIEELIDEAQSVNQGSNIKFTAGEEIRLLADADKIGSVISNFISNAVKYSDIGSPVIISCSRVGQDVQVSVQDQGIGIDEADRRKIFDRYVRVATRGKWHISGFGIGLYLSAEIIRRHGGKIWVDSEFGKGSVFHFSLPLGDARAQ